MSLEGPWGYPTGPSGSSWIQVAEPKKCLQLFLGAKKVPVDDLWIFLSLSAYLYNSSIHMKMLHDVFYIYTHNKTSCNIYICIRLYIYTSIHSEVAIMTIETGIYDYAPFGNGGTGSKHYRNVIGYPLTGFAMDLYGIVFPPATL